MGIRQLQAGCWYSDLGVTRHSFNILFGQRHYVETLTCDIPIRKQSLQLKLIHLTTRMYILELVMKNFALI